MAIINIIDRLTDEMEKNFHTMGVFIDLSKAFDTINHEILLKKLNHYGISGLTNDWFHSYLSDRKQHVCVNNCISSTRTVLCGVPQGSILGPLLFIIYINDLTNVSSLIEVVMFADDTNLFIKEKSIEKLTETANLELSKISKWFKLNKLSLNIKKTNFILFRNKKRKHLTSVPIIKIDDTKIEQVQNTKFLGVIINESLTWNDHRPIFTVKQKMQKNIGIM
jgi:hypothetical protein